jgi:hypothetical protein
MGDKNNAITSNHANLFMRLLLQIKGLPCPCLEKVIGQMAGSFSAGFKLF